MADRHDDTYEDWLRGRHAQFGTPFEVIDDLMRRATGSGFARIERIVRGESNEVHAVTSSSGDEVIVRFNHKDGAAAFRRAEAVIGRARVIGIPVPDSLLIEEIEVDGRDRGVCVQRRLKGTPLADSVKDIASDDVKALVADAGELVARLHSLPAEHEPRSAWWQEVPDFAIERARAALGAGASVVDDALEALAAIVASHAPDEPTTVHSDFGPEHLLVDGGRITGIIDWDQATVSSPMAGMFRDVDGAEDDPRRTVAGYTIRAVRESARELEARVAVHRRAWRPASLPYVDGRSVNPEAESSFTPEAYKAVRSTWLYDAELDLVAVASDGELAACCIGWFDRATSVTEIEPLGVAPEHRRRGLAVALCLEIAARAEAGGGSQVFVNTAPRADYPAPASAYTQAGFQVRERATTYVLPPQDGKTRSGPPATTAGVNPSAVRQGGRG